MSPSGGHACLVAQQLSVVRGGRVLLDRLSFSLHAGELVLLTGPNGSGKTSLLRALLGLTPLRGGRLQVPADGPFGQAGACLEVIEPRALARLTLYQGHAAAAKPELLALENLELNAALDDTTTEPADLQAALARVGLSRQAMLQTRRLSQGQKQRLQLARYALNLIDRRRPADRGSGQTARRMLWLMDEPSSALDDQGAALVQDLLEEHLTLGGSALAATHLPITLEASPVRALRLGAPGSSA